MDTQEKESEDFTNPDPGVRVVVRVLDLLEWGVAYEWFWQVERFRGEKLAYWYVGGWFTVLATSLGTSEIWVDGSRALMVFLVVLAAWRLFDVLRWWSDLLLDRAHYHTLSEERTLLFAVANLAEIALIGAIWLRATGQADTTGTAIFASFSLVTQLDLPTVRGAWAKVAVAATEIAALVLLLGGVAALIAEVFGKLRSGGPHQGQPKRRG